MRARKIVESQEFVFSPDDFYAVMAAHVNAANPPAHMSCDDLRDPMAFGLQLFPVRTYETLHRLNQETDHGEHRGSRDQQAEA